MDNRDFRIKEVFDFTVKSCARSNTKVCSLDPDEFWHGLLADALQKAGIRFGVNVSNQYMEKYFLIKPNLVALFTHVSNYILEKTFHIGSCQLQAEVGLFEFCKKGMFHISLAHSNLGNIQTNHTYLMIHEKNNNDVYFDTWANTLCKWKELKPDPDNKYLRDLKTTKQTIDTPLIDVFKDEISILENIILCLTEYKDELNKMTLKKNDFPAELKNHFAKGGSKFLNEMEFLFDFPKCRDALLQTIACEKKIFEERLATVKQAGYKTINLSEITDGFFKQKHPVQWKPYPKETLEKIPQYTGHDVRFFTFPANDATSQKKDEFLAHLKEHGLSAQLKQTKDKNPSIVVDLTASSCKL